MSFNTDPDLYSFNVPPGDCLLCYAADKTPETLFVEFIGIQIGDDWTPGDPPPPNGTFELTHVFSCEWNLNDGTYFIDYIRFPLNMVLRAGVIGVDDGFLPVAPTGACEIEFLNNLSSPVGNTYFGGTGIVMNPLDSGVRNNIQLMNLLNILPENRTFCKPQTIAEDILTTRYTDRDGRTNIYIKYDFT